ncbi:hypothetical protein GCM10027402_29240 [Arthrobacter monumenti]
MVPPLSVPPLEAPSPGELSTGSGCGFGSGSGSGAGTGSGSGAGAGASDGVSPDGVSPVVGLSVDGGSVNVLPPVRLSAPGAVFSFGITIGDSFTKVGPPSKVGVGPGCGDVVDVAVR